MRSRGAAGEGTGRIPRLAPDCDPTRLALSPAEGFLLSRIDGHTPQSVLRAVGGLPPADVDRCIADWARAGIVLFGGSGPRARGDAAAPARAPRDRGASPDAGAPAIDPGLEIAPEAQQGILTMEARLERPYHEILGVAPDADTRTVKRAYFALSKEFHPDRYFRREIGPFRERLEAIFRKLVEAYELLSDPAVRAEVQRSLEAEAAPPAGAPRTGTGRRRPRPDAFSPLLRGLARRKARAKTLFEAGMAAAAEERWIEAAGSVRLAIAFDPRNPLYRERFGEIQPRAHEVRFEQLMKEADSALSFRDRADALRIYEEALHYRPYDPVANFTAARLAWLAADDLRLAKEYAVRACEADPGNSEYRKVLGLIYKAAGLHANARRELQKAVRLDPGDEEARAELKSL